MLFFLSTITVDDNKNLDNLISMVNNGDKNALAEIYRIAGGRMLSVAIGIMRNKFLAEDVLSESFIKVVRFSSTYKKGTNAYAWLCTIVRNTAYNKIKNEKIHRCENIDDFYSISGDRLYFEDKENAILVEGALKQLSPRERTVIWLKYYNDLTVREIAGELNLPRSTVQSTISAAEKKLKELFKD